MGDIRDITIKLIIFIGISAGVATFYTTTLSSYGAIPANVDFSNTSADTLALTNSTAESLRNVKFTTDIPSLLTSGVSILQAGYATLLLMFSLVNIFTGLGANLIDISGLAGVPWLAAIIGALITAMILFGIIKFLRPGSDI